MARLMFNDKTLGSRAGYNKVDYAKGWRNVSLRLEPLKENWWEDPDVKIALNFPRVSVALERLMGTNVVRLTDRHYVNTLHRRIIERYRDQLNKRIKTRELQEVERQRRLIMEGKTNIIPEELRSDPIFQVHKRVNKITQKKRGNLKTLRERNAKLLKIRGNKWERERVQHEEDERKRLEMLDQRRRERKELQENLRIEDGENGMNLLRIHDENWRPCEQDLKQFLEAERAELKARSNKIPTSFSSDPLDIRNVARTRQRDRAAKRALRAKLLEQAKREKMKRFPACEQKHHNIEIHSTAALTAASHASNLVGSYKGSMDSSKMKLIDRYSLVDLCEESSGLSEEEEGDETAEVASTLSESKRRHAAELEEELEADVAKGLLISKEQYEHLSYRDDIIFQLRHARDIEELHKLTEAIILGDRPEEEEEEEVEEEQQPEMIPEEEGSSYSQ